MRDLADDAAAEEQDAGDEDDALNDRHPLPETGQILLHGDDHEGTDHRAEYCAEAAYQQSKLTREVAEIAVTEYVEGVYKQEKETIQGEIALAKSELKRAEDRLEWDPRPAVCVVMASQGYPGS